MIIIEMNQGRYIPIFVCDYCQQKIEQVDQGLYHFRLNESREPVSMFIYHKSCEDIVEKELFVRKKDLFYTQALSDFISQLIRNTGIEMRSLVLGYCDESEMEIIMGGKFIDNFGGDMI
jgi:hypothetical protein